MPNMVVILCQYCTSYVYLNCIDRMNTNVDYFHLKIDLFDRSLISGTNIDYFDLEIDLFLLSVVSYKIFIYLQVKSVGKQK